MNFITFDFGNRGRLKTVLFYLYICVGEILSEVNKISKNFAINQEIREKEVRLISSTGEQLGVVSGRDAQRMADEAELDLVMISPNAKPPVCKIMDYGKFIYEQSKKEKEAKKKQKVISVKEIRVSPTIEKHDLEIKAKNAKKFLEAGDKVKITVRFRGREAEHSHVGVKILDSFLAQLEEVCSVEKPAKLEGRNMIMILAPKKA